MKTHRLAGALAGSLTLIAVLAPAPVAALAEPASVNLRVRGISHELPRTAVTTSSTPLGIGGQNCSGTSDAGALNAGVGRANWAAHYDSGFNAFVLDSVYGEALGFTSPAFWAILVNGQPNSGFCTSELGAGAEVVYYAACNAFYTGPPGPCYGDPLRLGAIPATVKPGLPFQVKVDEATVDALSNSASYAPSVGATVTAGSATATTDAQGIATLTPTTAGAIVIRATKGNRLDDSRPSCVSDGADGFCGSVVPPDRSPPVSSLSGVAEGARFAKGRGPRQLTGTVTDRSTLRMVKLRITRTNAGRCSYFSGRTLRFRPARCGAKNGSWFKIGSEASWTYLLPQRLAAGRYVVDVNAIDDAYNRDDPRRRGGNRVVFVVG